MIADTGIELNGYGRVKPVGKIEDHKGFFLKQAGVTPPFYYKYFLSLKYRYPQTAAASPAITSSIVGFFGSATGFGSAALTGSLIASMVG